MIHRSCGFIPAFILVAIALPSRTHADAPPATQPASVEFLSGQAAKDAIIDDSADPYFSKLEEHEMTAKTSSPITCATHAEKLAECKRRYQDATVDFTDSEKSTLTFFIEQIQVPLKRDYPVFGNTPWSFIKVRDTLEGGMPHTRGGHIVMPEGVLSHFITYKKKMGANAIPGATSLLIHEQTHVLEREHPDLFQSLFTDTLHFIHAGKIESNRWLTDRQLVNPDGTVCDWIYPLTEEGKPSYVLPLIAFDDPDPSDLRHGLGMIAVTMEKTADGFKPAIGGDGNPIVRPLTEVTEYMKGPGAESDNYHPNEIIADRFAELVVIDDLLTGDAKKRVLKNGGEKLTARLKPIRDWATTAFKDSK